jgi:FkbM family methyltransferase
MILRPPPSTDLDTAYELFVAECYRNPVPDLNPDSVECVVDLGANVGYSCLYWLEQFPNAKVIAFEPHPMFASQLNAQLRLNGWCERVELHPVAAGIRPDNLMLSDAENQSSLLWTKGARPLPIRVVDVFPLLNGRRIDLFKMDVEGWEYHILGDARFAALAIRILVVEWHCTPQQPNGREWCVRRLRDLGFQTIEGQRFLGNGILWGYRQVV